MRVIITGGRAYADAARVYSILAQYPITELAHGNASGADYLADCYAMDKLDLPPRRYPANWEAPCRVECEPDHRRPRRDGSDYCPAAGNFRNQWMIEDFDADAVIAFPGDSGTADCVKRAIAAGVKVEDYRNE